MLICEELFLLLTRDDGKPESAFTSPGYGYAAAAITDLVLAGRVDLSDDDDPRVTVVDPSPTDNRLLDEALARVREKDGKKLSSLVTDGKVAPEKRIAESLERAGVVRVEEGRMLGFVPDRRPAVDPAPERHLRERLRVALQGREVTPHEATLLSILSALELAPKVLQEETVGMSRKEVKARIKEVTAEVEAGDAVRKAVATMNTVILTAVILPAVMGGSN